jgi:nucleotide-binding universal stress UspA family protein
MAYTIVVGYDGSEMSEKALDAAVQIAKIMPEGEIMVACAQDRPAPAVGFRGVDFGVEELWEKVVASIEEGLAEASAKVSAAGVKVATACTPDSPHVSIIRIAKDVNAALIVVGTKGAGARPGERTALGSTVTKLLYEKGDIPVLVV